MDKYIHSQLSVKWNYLSALKLQGVAVFEWISNFIPHSSGTDNWMVNTLLFVIIIVKSVARVHASIAIHIYG